MYFKQILCGLDMNYSFLSASAVTSILDGL